MAEGHGVTSSEEQVVTGYEPFVTGVKEQRSGTFASDASLQLEKSFQDGRVAQQRMPRWDRLDMSSRA